MDANNDFNQEDPQDDFAMNADEQDFISMNDRSEADAPDEAEYDADEPLDDADDSSWNPDDTIEDEDDL